MEPQHEERTLSTSDLADRDPDEAAGGREGELPAAGASEASRLSSRDETDGRYDRLKDEADTGPGIGSDTASPLFDQGEVRHFQSEWEAIQAGFVDEPRRAVARGDALVADLMQRLATSFAQERSRLEAQWDRGDDVSTEDLRLALQRYRSFFGRLLQA